MLSADEEFKQVIVVRKDLNLSKGKLSAQVAHAAVTAAGKSPFKGQWIHQGQKKSVLACEDEAGLRELKKAAEDARLPCALIEDAGRTHLSPGTTTCLGIGPAPTEEIDKITGHLKLL
ncbi:MAG: peptidyl-tRNA hydrolase Pth2 [Candidatus Altiarchaeota archaeon]